MALDKVVDSAILDGAMTATANAIREKTGKTDKIVWNETKGFSDAVGEAYEAGKKAENDAMWGAILDNGERTNFRSCFLCWNCEYIRPPVKIVPTINAGSRNSVFNGNKSLKRIEKEYFDFSQCQRGTANDTGYFQTFYNCPSLEVVEDVGMNNAYSFYGTFGYDGKLHTIECIYPDENTLFYNTFDECRNLVYLRVNGTIGKNGFNVSSCTKLDKESHISVFNAFSTTAAISATFSKVAVDKAFETSEGSNDGSTSAEWLGLVGTRPNVTVLLA